MKVLFVTFSSSRYDGSNVALLSLIKGLRKLGVDCYVVLPNRGNFENDLKRARIHYVVLTRKLLPAWWASPKRNPFFDMIVKILKVLNIGLFSVLIASKARELDVDLIYSNALVSPVGGVAAILVGKPHVWHIREFIEEDFGLHFDLGLRRTMKLVDRMSCEVIVVSKAVRKKFGRFFPKSKVHVVYDGVEANLKQRRKKSRKKIILLMVGRLHPNKGHSDAIRAILELKKVGLKAELWIVGNGSPYKKELEDLVERVGVKNEVVFFSRVPDLSSIRTQADVFLVCSRSEAFGLVTIEAMLSRLPVIGARSGATPELVHDGKTGFLYTPGDHRELATKILQVLRNPKKLRRIVEKAYKYAQRNFNAENNSKKIHKILLGVLKRC